MRAVGLVAPVAVGWLLSAGSGAAQERFAERTFLPRKPPEHTQERAGNPASVAWWAQPGVGPHEAGGYIGGGRLRGNAPLSKSAGGLGPTETGTLGWDFVGFGRRPGRVFLGASPEGGKDRDYARGYRTDGTHHIPDVFAVRPIRKAVLESKEDNGEHKAHGKE